MGENNPFVRSSRRAVRPPWVLTIGVLCATATAAADPLLILSAFPAEGAKVLSSAESVTELGTFNGRRFFTATLAGQSVIMGLTGIGTVNATSTTTAVLDFLQDEVSGIVFSGVAGSDKNIGDVTIPDQWSDGDNTYAVSEEMRVVAAGLAGNVTLESCVGAPDTACTANRPDARTTACFGDPQIHAGGLGYTSDPFGDRAVPCLSSAGDLLGCEACGAPLDMQPSPERFVTDTLPFLTPFFFLDLLQSFESPPGGYPVAIDMETAPVAGIASDRGIPFIAFRAVSDGGGDPLMLPGFPFQFFAYQQLAADNAGAVTIAFVKVWGSQR